MQVVLNGEKETLEDALTLAQLIERKGLAEKRIALEVNEQIISKSRHPQFVLNDGDKVEIITAIGGG